MPHKAVKPVIRANAKRLRVEMTEAELKLWNQLRAHRLMGLGFRRQYPIAGYIVDFACPRHKLIIEVDGSQHAEAGIHDYDIVRTQKLEKDGWTMMRFWNKEVLSDIDGTCNHIIAVLTENGVEL